MELCYSVKKRYINMAEKDKNKGWQNIPEKNFRTPLSDLEIFKKIVDAFPYPVAAYTPDGTAIYTNAANINLYHFILSETIGKYNLFKDPTIDAVMPYEKIKRVHKGEIVFFPAVKVPLSTLSSRSNFDYGMEALYIDMTFFPIMEDSRLVYFIQFQVPCRVYHGKKEIEKAKEYIDNNWLEKFNLKEVAKAAGLSQAHLTRLFKQHTGITAHVYYVQIKINKIKEKLSDPQLSVAEAFTACNLDYNGYYARVFKTHTGVTPSEYKKGK